MTERPDRRALGATGLQVSAVTLGAAPLGSMPETFGYEVTEQDAVDLVRAVLPDPQHWLDAADRA